MTQSGSTGDFEREIEKYKQYIRQADIENRTAEEHSEKLKELEALWTAFEQQHRERIADEGQTPNTIYELQELFNARQKRFCRLQSVLYYRIAEKRQAMLANPNSSNQPSPTATRTVPQASTSDDNNGNGNNAEGDTADDDNDSIFNLSFANLRARNPQPPGQSAPNQNTQANQVPMNLNVSALSNDPNQMNAMFFSLIQRMCTGVANKKENTWGYYDGDITKWIGFRDAFTAAVDKDPLIEPVFKFQLLMSSLKGKASEQMGQWPIGNENYEEAWNWLNELNSREYYLGQRLFMKLVDFKKLEKPSGYWLERLSTTAQGVVRQLRASKYPVDNEYVWVYLIHSKMDAETSREWELKRESQRPTFNQIIAFLTARGRALTHVNTEDKNHDNNRKRSGSEQKSNDSKRVKKDFSPANKNDKSINQANKNDRCKLCKDGIHYMQSCKKFIEMTVKNRQNVVRENNLCWNCLNPSHAVRDCKARTCKKCEGKHHTMLCKNSQETASVNSANAKQKKGSAQKKNQAKATKQEKKEPSNL